MSGIGYALLCVVVPLAWGLIVVWITKKIEAKVHRPEKDPIQPLEG